MRNSNENRRRWKGGGRGSRKENDTSSIKEMVIVKIVKESGERCLIKPSRS